MSDKEQGKRDEESVAGMEAQLAELEERQEQHLEAGRKAPSRELLIDERSSWGKIKDHVQNPYTSEHRNIWEPSVQEALPSTVHTWDMELGGYGVDDWKDYLRRWRKWKTNAKKENGVTDTQALDVRRKARAEWLFGNAYREGELRQEGHIEKDELVPLGPITQSENRDQYEVGSRYIREKWREYAEDWREFGEEKWKDEEEPVREAFLNHGKIAMEREMVKEWKRWAKQYGVTEEDWVDRGKGYDKEYDKFRARWDKRVRKMNSIIDEMYKVTPKEKMSEKEKQAIHELVTGVEEKMARELIEMREGWDRKTNPI